MTSRNEQRKQKVAGLIKMLEQDNDPTPEQVSFNFGCTVERAKEYLKVAREMVRGNEPKPAKE